MTAIPCIKNPDDRLAAYWSLLLRFQGLPGAKHPPTFMEICGYPHYENVCSNVLKFYFDPKAEHGLGNLLISSLLHLCGRPTGDIHDAATVVREYGAEGQQRIDLVIQTDLLVIAIENKIFHWEANDFENYARTIQALAGRREVYKVVLCLHEDRETSPGGGFQRCTYRALWQLVRKHLGDHLPHANPKWLTCLIDFMETTENLSGANKENGPLDRFFVENHLLLEQLFSERSRFLERLSRKVEALLDEMKGAEEAKLLSVPLRLSQSVCLVMDLNLKGQYRVAFDLWLQPEGWELHLFGRDASSTAYLSELSKGDQLKSIISGERVWGHRWLAGRWTPGSDLGTLREALCRSIRTLVNAANATRSPESSLEGGTALLA